MNIRGKRVARGPGRARLGGVSTVLLVEDDPEIVALLGDFLAVEGFGVVSAADPGGAIDALGAHPIACVVLDVMLSGGSGFDVCRRIRERSEVPLLFLSARGEDEDKLRGLALGADDYIVKSATPAEVVARVKAVLRRSTPRDPGRRVYGRFAVDRAAHEVTADGRPLAPGLPATCRQPRAGARRGGRGDRRHEPQRQPGAQRQRAPHGAGGSKR